MSRTLVVALLWIEALVCFGPLAFVLLLGMLIFPFWASMLVGALVGEIGWVDGAGRTMWDVVWPMMFVLGGLIGLAGLTRMLVALSQRDHALRPSTTTAVMILIGLVALVSFNLYGRNLPGNLRAALVYYVLPGLGSLHFLYLGRAVWLPRRRHQA